MLPFNYAILRFVLRHGPSDADAVMAGLADDYRRFRQFRKKAVVEALMTARANGLLEETHFDLDDAGDLRVFYQVTESGRRMITRYIGG